MIDLHASDETIESFVIGAMDPHEATALARHTTRCESCARRLQKEAQLELQMTMVRCEVRRRSRRMGAFSVPRLGALAALATLLVFLVNPARVAAPARVRTSTPSYQLTFAELGAHLPTISTCCAISLPSFRVPAPAAFGDELVLERE